jgi:hypothetical protein
MAKFTATWTDTEATDWEAGDFFRTDKFRDQFGQNVEFLAQSHDHSGDAGDGATLPTADPKYIWWSMIGGAPFA